MVIIIEKRISTCLGSVKWEIDRVQGGCRTSLMYSSKPFPFASAGGSASQSSFSDISLRCTPNDLSKSVAKLSIILCWSLLVIREKYSFGQTIRGGNFMFESVCVCVANIDTDSNAILGQLVTEPLLCKLSTNGDSPCEECGRIKLPAEVRIR
jgi:hypothetical protein